MVEDPKHIPVFQRSGSPLENRLGRGNIESIVGGVGGIVFDDVDCGSDSIPSPQQLGGADWQFACPDQHRVDRLVIVCHPLDAEPLNETITNFHGSIHQADEPQLPLR